MQTKREFTPRNTPRAPTRDMMIERGELCPDCGSRQMESNGRTEYRCIECDHRWGVEFGMPYGY